jgi:hypothetical protein
MSFIAFQVVQSTTSAMFPKREYINVTGDEGSLRTGKIPRNLFQDLPENFVFDPSSDFSHRRTILLDSCGSVDLNGFDPLLDAHTVAAALVGNSGLNIVPGSPRITAWPGYGMISTWKIGHSIRPFFPNGSDPQLSQLKIRLNL